MGKAAADGSDLVFVTSDNPRSEDPLAIVTAILPGIAGRPHVVELDRRAAIQRAIDDHTGRHHILYFPRGTYLVSATLKWPKKVGERDNWGMTFLCGESAETSIMRRRDATFTAAVTPEAIMWCGGFGSADWFHNYVEQGAPAHRLRRIDRLRREREA